MPPRKFLDFVTSTPFLIYMIGMIITLALIAAALLIGK
jgi:hypothetical protein